MEAFSYFDGQNSPPIIGIGFGTYSTLYQYSHLEAK
jgi:hypothetical protein